MKLGESQSDMIRRILAFTLVLLLLVSAGPLVWSQGDCDFRYSNYARAVQLHEMGDYERALRQYECARQADPDSAIIPLLIENLHQDVADAGSAWSGTGDETRSSICSPNLDHGHLGQVAFDRGDNSQALLHLQCALLRDANDETALYLTGRIYINRGETHSAQHYFDRAEAARTVAGDTPNLAGDPVSAAKFEMPEWLTPYETVPDSRRPAQAQRIVNFGERSRLLAQAEQVIINAGERLVDARAEARRALNRSVNADANVAFIAAQEASPAQAIVERGREYAQSRRLFAAANTFIEALALDPEHVSARCQLGVIFTEWANYGAAMSQFDRILKTEPSNACAREHRKLAVLDMLAMYVPLTVDDFFYHARTLAQVEEWELARAAFRKGLTIDPTRFDARCELGMIYVQLGDDRAALREFDRVLAQNVVDACAWPNRDALMQRLRDES